MNTLQDRIAQFRKMTTELPDDELGFYRLGQLLTEAGEYREALKAFERTLEISPQFSKVFQLMGEVYMKLNENDQAITVMTKGYEVADARGDKMPRDAMGMLLTKLGAPVPNAQPRVVDDGPDTGFRCQRPGCPSGKRAVPIVTPPIDGEIGQRITREICTDCWTDWLKNFSIKVVNELRLDLSSEFGQGEYDKHMRGYFGFEDSVAS